MSQMRQRILIIGFDFQVLHTFYRTKDQSPSNDVQGFVYCGPGDPPITLAKSNTKTPIRVIPLTKLEEAISKYRITKCQFQAQNIPMKLANSIIYRITACNCNIEFLRQKDLKIKVNKPTIIVSALAHSIGKTQVCRYFCDYLRSRTSLRVAVIFPISEIYTKFDENTKAKGISEDNDFHLELNDVEEIPAKFFSDDDAWQIKEYLKSEIRVFATTDVRKAVISAEQYADLIFVDCRKCEFSFIDSKYRLCIISKDRFYYPDSVKNLWPGLLNLHAASEVILVSTNDSPASPNQVADIKRQLQDKPLYNVKSVISFDVSNAQIFNRKALVIEHKDTQGQTLRAANSLGADLISSNSTSNLGPIMASSDEDSDDNKIVNNSFSFESYKSDGEEISPLLAEGLPDDHQISSIVLNTPRASSPLLEEGVTEKTDEMLKNVVEQINKLDDVEIVICSLQRDIEGLGPGKTIVQATPVIEINKDLGDYLMRFDERSRKAPLQDHFSSQVDIIMSMAQASKQELHVSNNDSANREAFCRIFLSSHIPPGFRVTTGEIIDAHSNITGQLDVVVVNDSCPSLTIDSTNSIIAPILADNVLCTIEVKTSLTSDQLKKALNQMRPVKALMPSHSTLLEPNGKVIDDPLGGKIITGIFSFNNTNEIESEIEYILSLFPGVVDFVVIPDSFGYFWNPILRQANLKEETVPPDSNNYVKVTKKGMSLAFMFGILNAFAAIRRFSGSNCLKYLHGCWGDQREQAEKNLKNVKENINKMSKMSELERDVQVALRRQGNNIEKVLK